MKVRGSARELTPEAYSERVGRAVTERVRALAVAWQQTKTPAPPEDELTVALLDLPALMTSGNALDEEIGPFYDTAGVMKVLGGISKQAVQARRSKATVLAMRTSDGMWVYPVFQFDGAGVDPALLPAIQAFRDSPGWSTALWFVTDNDDLDGMTPVQWVRTGLAADPVTLSAQRTAAQWV